jgi:hypothetical protein
VLVRPGGPCEANWVGGRRTLETPLSSPPLDTFWTNPQFRLTLLEPDEEEDDDDEERPWGGWGTAGARGPARGGRVPKCTVLLSLIQRNRRCLRAKGLTYLTVGFHVFQVQPGSGVVWGGAGWRGSESGGGAERTGGEGGGQGWTEGHTWVHQRAGAQRTGGDQGDRKGPKAQMGKGELEGVRVDLDQRFNKGPVGQGRWRSEKCGGTGRGA